MINFIKSLFKKPSVTPSVTPEFVKMIDDRDADIAALEARAGISLGIRDEFGGPGFGFATAWYTDDERNYLRERYRDRQSLSSPITVERVVKLLGEKK